MTSIFKSDVDEDIESLLKELELEQDTIPNSQKSYKNKSYNLNPNISKYNYNEKNNKKHDDTTDELNDILQELSAIDTSTITNKKSSRPNIYSSEKNNINSKSICNNSTDNKSLDTSLLKDTKERPRSQHKAKCTTVCIGGQEGITIGSNQKSCSKLRCTSCDFNCIYYKDSEWSNNVDYLFFRNYVPNTEKLAKELIPKKGYTAICCQCTWYTVNKTTPIVSIKNKKIKWVC
ncbi:hypothetical protein BCR32DRAFT_270474, partial [Anaeromyces robustus]